MQENTNDTQKNEKSLDDRLKEQQIKQIKQDRRIKHFAVFLLPIVIVIITFFGNIILEKIKSKNTTKTANSNLKSSRNDSTQFISFPPKQEFVIRVIRGQIKSKYGESVNNLKIKAPQCNDSTKTDLGGSFKLDIQIPINTKRVDLYIYPKSGMFHRYTADISENFHRITI